MAEFWNGIIEYGSQWKASYFSDHVTVLGPITVAFGWHFSIKNTNLEVLVFCKTILIAAAILYLKYYIHWGQKCLGWVIFGWKPW
jgi:hypothetical protein